MIECLLVEQLVQPVHTAINIKEDPKVLREESEQGIAKR